jgi:hypothetical protein
MKSFNAISKAYHSTRLPQLTCLLLTFLLNSCYFLFFWFLFYLFFSPFLSLFRFLSGIFPGDPVSDSLLTSLYRYLCGYGDALLQDAMLFRLVHSLMAKLFRRLIGELRRLGTQIIYADFNRIVIHTNKQVLYCTVVIIAIIAIVIAVVYYYFLFCSFLVLGCNLCFVY